MRVDFKDPKGLGDPSGLWRWFSPFHLATWRGLLAKSLSQGVFRGNYAQSSPFCSAVALAIAHRVAVARRVVGCDTIGARTVESSCFSIERLVHRCGSQRYTRQQSRLLANRRRWRGDRDADTDRNSEDDAITHAHSDDHANRHAITADGIHADEIWRGLHLAG